MSKQFKNVSKNELAREYIRSVKQVENLQNVLKVVAARLYKHKPEDKVFHDGTFIKESLETTAKLASASWKYLDAMHGEKKEKKAKSETKRP